MNIIDLGKGVSALVDESNFEWLSRWNWHVFRAKGHKNYAYRWDRNDDGKRIRVFMHRAILGREAVEHTDHIDGDGLNNRMENLRPATCSQNLANRGKQRNNKSGYKGVSWKKHIGKWVAQIKFQGRVIYLGLYEDPNEAFNAYCESSKRLFGKFSRVT